MSYIAWINGFKLDLVNASLSQTKQVNDIANITTRNSNFTYPLKVPRTANNIRIVEGTALLGVKSSFPYSRNVANIIDADSGLHVVYNGWAILTDSQPDYYMITFYDGFVEFWKMIENISITDVGVSELNHIKNIDNVVETWTDETKPYRYNLADYNGKNITSGSLTNIDFQVPSAKASFIWQRIFEFTGWEYEGTIFEHEKFQNLWLTYPKPVPTSSPITTLVTNQSSILKTDQVQWPVGNGVFLGSVTYPLILPNTISTASYSTVNGALSDGTYRMTFTGDGFEISSFTNETILMKYIKVVVYNQLNEIVQTSVVSCNASIDVFLQIGWKFVLTACKEDGTNYTAQVTPNFTSFMVGSVNTIINKIEGFTLGFDQAFIDYKVTKFIKEIMVNFGLTPFKDKYSNKIKFLTLFELLQNENIEDWSNKFISIESEKYSFGNYAKRNLFKYKYNDDEATHNNSFIPITNDNLSEEITLHQSDIYSPEKIKSVFLGGSNVYKIWEKQIKDDNTVEYKDLDRRFYFMRSEKINQSITIGSDILGGSESLNYYFRESFYRLSYANIIDDWLRPIAAILDEAKLITAKVWLKGMDVYNLDFSRLKYIKQLGGYFILNKINNFTKGKETKVELIEVDYYKELEPSEPEIGFVEIGTPTISSCAVTIPVTTNIDLAASIIVHVYQLQGTILGTMEWQEVNLSPLIQGTLASSSFTFPVDNIPYVSPLAGGTRFKVEVVTNAFISIVSNLSDAINIPESCYVPAVVPGEITISSAVYTGRNTNTYPYPNIDNYNLTYSYDSMPLGQSYVLIVEVLASWLGGAPAWYNVSETIKVQGQSNEFLQQVGVSLIYSNPTKFRIKINNTISNEYSI